MTRWLTVAAAAEYAGMSVCTIYRALESGQMSGCKSTPGSLRGTWRIKPEDVDRWLERGRMGRPAARRAG